jgi:sugar lactone lactonase YvrE
MGHRSRLGLLPLMIVLGCGSSAPSAPGPGASPGGTGGKTAGAGGKAGASGDSGSGGISSMPGGQGGGASPGDSGGAPGSGGAAAGDAPGADSAPPTTDAAAETGSTPDAVATLPPLGAFPLEAIKAAKAELYVKANAHVEGPTWRDGEVFFAADGAGWGFMRIDAARKLYRYHPSLRPVGSALLADGSMLVGDHGHVIEQIFPDGKVAELAHDFEGKPIEFANDLSVDAAGNIFTSGRHTGFLYRISPAGEVVKVASGLDLPNGVEVDPASKYLYFIASNNVMRLSLPATPSGTDFGKPEMVSGGGQPDGMMFDAWGNLWIADWRAGHLVVLSPEGKTITTVGSGGGPINLCAGGKDNDTIFVATDYKGIYKIGPIPGFRGFLHPGAAKYTIKQMLNLVPANTPVP